MLGNITELTRSSEQRHTLQKKVVEFAEMAEMRQLMI